MNGEVISLLPLPLLNNPTSLLAELDFLLNMLVWLPYVEPVECRTLRGLGEGLTEGVLRVDPGSDSVSAPLLDEFILSTMSSTAGSVGIRCNNATTRFVIL